MSYESMMMPMTTTPLMIGRAHIMPHAVAHTNPVRVQRWQMHCDIVTRLILNDPHTENIEVLASLMDAISRLYIISTALDRGHTTNRFGMVFMFAGVLYNIPPHAICENKFNADYEKKYSKIFLRVHSKRAILLLAVNAKHSNSIVIQANKPYSRSVPVLYPFGKSVRRKWIGAQCRPSRAPPVRAPRRSTR